ncbi:MULTISPECIES: Rieske 2Fe-2S domain-containing protein [unclassified Acinetobacter]|uniref:Rieske 2Fe-2S domain-containing protein n=1 Tax=unclassified Acinetobacter TaxID=196816 RepID=UPI0035B759A9
MNINKLKQAWYPLLASHQLKDKPIASKLLGQALVLARLNGQAVCFDDCCPHRHYPLSLGKIVNQRLQCGYHGWQFDATGAVCQISGGMCQKADGGVQAFACHEFDGWIWVCLTQNIPFQAYAEFCTPTGFEHVETTKSLTGDFIHAIENILDPTHTAYIHRLLLRNQSAQAMDIEQTHDQHSFCTYYRLVQQQNGLINRLFDKGIHLNEARFRFPALVSIDYFTPKSHEYRVSVFFIPKDKGEIGLSIRIHLPKNRIPLTAKIMLLRPFLEMVLYQDKVAIAKQYHTSRYPKQAYQSTVNDLVIDHLLYLLADAPEGQDKTGRMTL